jgi:hypothetical protein
LAYLGNSSLPFDPTRTAAAPRDADRFSGNGSTVTFTLSRAVPKAVDIQVFVENVPQEPLFAYDVNGTSLTFTGAPPSGTNNVYVVYRNFDSGAQVYVPDGSITYSKLANNIRIFTTDNLTPNGNNSVFTLSEPPADANTVMVTVDGVMQRAPVHYTTSGSTITFTSAPPAGSNVHVRHLGFRTTTAVTQLSANSTITTPTITTPTVTGGTLTSSSLITPSFSGNVAFSNANSWSIANTGGSTLVSVDSVGRMIRPNQPMFNAANNSGTAASNQTVKILWDLVNINNGLYYSTSTHRFTCPVAGYYLVSCHGMSGSTTTGGVNFQIYLYKNGAQYTSQVGYTYIDATSYRHASSQWIASAAAGDYLEIYAGGTLGFYGSGLNGITIQLIN